MPDDEKSDSYKLTLPFFIEGSAYSDRDKEMFVCGFEFCMLWGLVHRNEKTTFTHKIRLENEERARVMCSRAGRKCDVKKINEEFATIIIYKKEK